MNKDRILVVEDSHVLLAQIAKVLQPYYEVVTCSTIKEYYEKVDCDPTLILMDYNIDDMTCMDLIGAATSPVIILTGEQGHDTELACLKEGAVDYVKKPFHPKILLHRIDMHISIVKTRAMLEGYSFECSLTGLKNRRALERDFLMISSLRKREDVNLSAALMLLDIDKFKSVNDTYGHDVGDIVLKELAKIMRKTCKRLTDGVYRWGGEEFVILVPVCTAEQTANFSELVRRAVEKAEIIYPDGVLKITISIGAVNFKSESSNLIEVLKCADELLYQAKNSGRNNVQFKVI